MKRLKPVHSQRPAASAPPLVSIRAEVPPVTHVSSSHSGSHDNQLATMETESCVLLTRLYSGVSSSEQLRPLSSCSPRRYLTCRHTDTFLSSCADAVAGSEVCSRVQPCAGGLSNALQLETETWVRLAELMFSWFCLTRSTSGVTPTLVALAGLCLYFTCRSIRVHSFCFSTNFVDFWVLKVQPEHQPLCETHWADVLLVPSDPLHLWCLCDGSSTAHLLSVLDLSRAGALLHAYTNVFNTELHAYMRRKM